MAIKTKDQLITQNNNLIKANANEEITGSILNTHLKDFIDSFQIESGFTSDFSIEVTETTPTISGSSTSILLLYNVIPFMAVNVNGETFKVGNSDISKFYITDPTGLTVRDYDEMLAGDELRYNAAELEYTLENTDVITLTYLRQA